MATAYLMSEKELDLGLTKFTATVKEMQDGAQALLLPCVEYAIRNCNATYCNRLLAAIPDKMRPYMREYMTRKGIPLVFDKDKKAVAFSYRVAKIIYKEKMNGKQWDTKADPNNLSDNDKTALEFLSAIALTLLDSGKWYDNLKADQRAEREAAKAGQTKASIAEALTKSLNNLKERAKKAGVELPIGDASEVTTVTATPIPADVQEIVNILLPLSGNNAVLAQVLNFAIGLMSSDKKAA